MGHHDYTVEFRIFSKTLDPTLITKELGLRPCQTWTEGAERIRGRVDPGMWAYNGTEEEKNVSWSSLEEGLTFVLSKLWSCRETLGRYKTTGARLIWWCGHFYSTFDGGPLLSATLLGKLGEFDAELFIDNHHVNEDGPERIFLDKKAD